MVAFSAESNHYHAVVYDRHGNLPAFLAHFHKMLAKVLNCHLGRWENFWASEPTGYVECIAPEDVFGESIYTLTNPVKDQLVERVFLWPGANSLAAQLRDDTRDVVFPAGTYLLRVRGLVLCEPMPAPT